MGGGAEQARMSRHTAHISWTRDRDREPFVGGDYCRAHCWRFDGGLTVPASASPHIVPVPKSDPSAVDPEEAFVASLSSCHMLWFLSLAAERGFVVDAYEDDAEGMLGRDGDGRLAITRVVLRPRVTFGGDVRPTDDEVAGLHEGAHGLCFLARSVKGEVVVEGVGCEKPRMEA